MARILLKILFFFQIQFYSSSKFGNSYLVKYLSKNHEISSIILLNSCSIQEKYKT
jgi:hypothetical protein